MNLSGSVHIDLTPAPSGGGLQATVTFVAGDGSEYELMEATEIGPGHSIRIDGIDAECTLSTSAIYDAAGGPAAPGRQPAIARPAPTPPERPPAPTRRGR